MPLEDVWKARRRVGRRGGLMRRGLTRQLHGAPVEPHSEAMLAQALRGAKLRILARTDGVAGVPGLAITAQNLAVDTVLIEEHGAGLDKSDRPRQTFMQRGGEF